MLKNIVVAIAVLFYLTGTAMAADNITISCDVPYFLGQKRSEITKGESLQIRIAVESCDKNQNTVPINIYLPLDFIPAGDYEYWQVTRQDEFTVLRSAITLEGGYDQWFDLVAVKASSDMLPGQYKIYLELGDFKKEYLIDVGERRAELAQSQSGFGVEKVVLPLDKDGKKDERLNENTLVLRDKTLDYFRNILRGQGASNLEAEESHPISYAGIDVLNSVGEQKLVTVTARLLDYQTRQPELGLVTSKAGSDDDIGYDNISADREGSRAFTAITGEPRQRILLPLYADEKLAAGGRYWLQLSVDDGAAETVVSETEITVVKKNFHAIVVVGAACLFFSVGLCWGLPRLRTSLSQMKTRWLITVALFGTTTFACVNVPSTILGDFFHILLGPFGFLITGVFTGVFLYMLMISLIILIPRPGIITLVMAIRMLLGMLVFGNISLISILSYGLQALLLELALYRFYRYGLCTSNSDTMVAVVRQALPIAIACGIVDCISTYINMQCSIFLYRMYFADWYIYLVLLFNGLLYTMLGVFCGFILGRELVKIRGD